MTTTRTLLVNVAAPLVLYYGLRAAGTGDVVALAAGAVLTGADAVRTAVRERRVDGFAVLSVLAVLVGLAGALITGDPRELLVRNAWLTAPFGIWTLLTLRSERPLCYVVTRLLLVHRAARMEDLWRTDPRFRRAWRDITIMWGALTMVDALLRVVIAYTLPVATVPALDSALWVVTAVLLQVPTHLLLLRSGTWHLLFGRGRRVVTAGR
jgi:hypothetical protein